MAVDFWDLTKLLVRRWVIFVPLLVVSGGLAVLTLSQVKPDYVATAYVQLVPPPIGDSTPGGSTAINRNPFLSQSLESLGNAAIVTVTDHSVVDALKAAGYSESYTLTMGTDGPLVTFEVVGKTRQQASATADELISRFTRSVTNLQRSTATVADADLIKAVRLDRGTNVEKSFSKVKRAVVAVAGAGILIDIGVIVGLDAWLRRRRQRRDAAAAQATALLPRTGKVVVSSSARPLPDRRPGAELTDTAYIPIGSGNGGPVGNGTSVGSVSPVGNGGTTANGNPLAGGAASGNGAQVGNGAQMGNGAGSGAPANPARDAALANIAAGMSLDLAQDKASGQATARREGTAAPREGTAAPGPDASQPADQGRARDDGPDPAAIPSDATIVLPLSLPRAERPVWRRRGTDRDTPA